MPTVTGLFATSLTNGCICSPVNRCPRRTHQATVQPWHCYLSRNNCNIYLTSLSRPHWVCQDYAPQVNPVQSAPAVHTGIYHALPPLRPSNPCPLAPASLPAVPTTDPAPFDNPLLPSNPTAEATASPPATRFTPSTTS